MKPGKLRRIFFFASRSEWLVVLYCVNLVLRSLLDVQKRSGARFSKVPVTFLARRYILKSKSTEWCCSF